MDWCETWTHWTISPFSCIDRQTIVHSNLILVVSILKVHNFIILFTYNKKCLKQTRVTTWARISLKVCFISYINACLVTIPSSLTTLTTINKKNIVFYLMITLLSLCDKWIHNLRRNEEMYVGAWPGKHCCFSVFHLKRIIFFMQVKLVHCLC